MRNWYYDVIIVHGPEWGIYSATDNEQHGDKQRLCHDEPVANDNGEDNDNA